MKTIYNNNEQGLPQGGPFFVASKVSKKEENTMKARVMKRAWELCRAGAVEFGGLSKEYISSALKIAWREVRAKKTNERGDAGESAETIKAEKEEKEMSYKDVQTLALMVKNKVEANNVFRVDSGTGRVGKDGDLIVIKIGREMQQLQQAGLQNMVNPTLMTQDVIEANLPYWVENVDSSYAETLAKQEVPVIDARQGITVAFGGDADEVVYGTTGSLKEGDLIDVSKLIKFKPGFTNPGVKREGGHGILKEEDSYLDYANKHGIKIESFQKVTDKGLEFAGKKIGTRFHLSASAGGIVSPFKGYRYVATEHKTYEHLGGELKSEVYLLANKRGKTVRLEVIRKDFTVETTEELYGPIFEGDKAEFGEFPADLQKVATDGTIFIDSAIAETVGWTHAATIRFAQLAKGLGVVMPELKEQTDSDLVFFGGAVKADILPYLKRGQLDMALLMHARLHDKKLIALSHQAAKRALTNEVFMELHEKTHELIGKAEQLDMDAVTQFLSIGTPLLEDDEPEEEDKLTAEDVQITHLYHENPELVLSERILRKRLRDFLRKQIDKYVNGERVILEDAVWRHMVSDPYTVMKYIAKGKMSVKREELTEGIRRGRSFTIVNGRINTDAAVLYRFPFLHLYEARKVNTQEGYAMDYETFSYYLKYKEHFRGLQIYSLADMHAEGQSGADFDGDTTIVVLNERIVETTEEHPLFLDYSLVDGKVVEGAPFEDVKPVDWSFVEKDAEVIAEHSIELHDNGDIIVGSGELTSEVEEFVWQAVAHLSMQSVAPGYVGLLSNASDTVVEYATTKEGKDWEKLDRLNSYLTVGVRWEIDKAKHGGAFYEQLPFLKAITEGAGVVDLMDMEEDYNITLSPLFSVKKDYARFSISQSIYYGNTAPKNALNIDSAEHCAIKSHIEQSKVLAEKAEAEESHAYHIYGYAKDMVNQGLAKGIITPAMVDAFEWNRVRNSQTADYRHPVKFLQAIGKKTAELAKAKREAQCDKEKEAIDAKMAEVRRAGLEFRSKVTFSIPGEYVFALTYASIAKSQFRMTRKKDEPFKMSHVSGLFTYFALESVDFFRAVDELTGAMPLGEQSFIITGAESVGEYLIVKHGVTNCGHNVMLEDLLYKEISGLFKVTRQIKAEAGLVVRGHFVDPEPFLAETFGSGIEETNDVEHFISNEKAVEGVNINVGVRLGEYSEGAEEMDEDIYMDKLAEYYTEGYC